MVLIPIRAQLVPASLEHSEGCDPAVSEASRKIGGSTILAVLKGQGFCITITGMEHASDRIKVVVDRSQCAPGDRRVELHRRNTCQKIGGTLDYRCSTIEAYLCPIPRTRALLSERALIWNRHGALHHAGGRIQRLNVHSFTCVPLYVRLPRE